MQGTGRGTKKNRQVEILGLHGVVKILLYYNPSWGYWVRNKTLTATKSQVLVAAL